MSGQLRIFNKSPLDQGLVEEVVNFVHEFADPSGSCAVRVLKPRPGGWNGWASDSRIHRERNFAGRLRFAVSCRPAREDCVILGKFHICNHSKQFKGIPTDREHEILSELVKEGKSRAGRWPIQIIMDQVESLVHIVGHEYGHVVQWDRERGTSSEVFCEEYSVRVLNAWRER